MSQLTEPRLRAMIAAVDDALAGIQDARENSHTLDRELRTHIDTHLDHADQNLRDALDALRTAKRRLIEC